jgi:uncharacterized membrane protein
MGTVMDPGLSWTLALALAIIFAASAAMKFVNVEQFAAAVENYRILPVIAVSAASWIIPTAEAAAALGLLLPHARASAALLLAGLIALFTAAIALNLARGRRQIDCGCFGPALRQTLSGWLIVRNLMLIGAAATLTFSVRVRLMGPIDVFNIVCGALTLTLLYASMNYLLANSPWIGELERLNG